MFVVSVHPITKDSDKCGKTRKACFGFDLFMRLGHNFNHHNQFTSFIFLLPF